MRKHAGSWSRQEFRRHQTKRLASSWLCTHRRACHTGQRPFRPYTERVEPLHGGQNIGDANKTLWNPLTTTTSTSPSQWHPPPRRLRATLHTWLGFWNPCTTRPTNRVGAETI